MTSWFEITSVQYVAKGDKFIGPVAPSGYGMHAATEAGYVLRFAGGCECVFVPESLLLQAVTVRKPAPMVGAGKTSKGNGIGASTNGKR